MIVDNIYQFEPHNPGGKVKTIIPDGVFSAAIYSPCKQYRYELHRRWKIDEPIRSIMFMMMNPSTATEEYDDPTVRKCQGFADRWGHNHMIVTNVMAYRATNPKDLLKVDDPAGPANLFIMHRLLNADSIPPSPLFLTREKPFLVCAWGRIPKKLAWTERNALMLIGNHKPYVLKLNKNGMPWHPLYLPNDTLPTEWTR